MKKDDLLTHFSFFGVLMTMAVLSAPVDAVSDNKTNYMSHQVFSNAIGEVVNVFDNTDTFSSKADVGRYNLALNDFKLKN